MRFHLVAQIDSFAVLEELFVHFLFSSLDSKIGLSQSDLFFAGVAVLSD
ncbi:hypothetical protein HZA43_01115 [Candidatus Peregrinibacteria bacterium]|nr:hypothetical protein [Candidatus Peregrinibacteria bacterium]